MQADGRQRDFRLLVLALLLYGAAAGERSPSLPAPTCPLESGLPGDVGPMEIAWRDMQEGSSGREVVLAISEEVLGERVAALRHALECACGAPPALRAGRERRVTVVRGEQGSCHIEEGPMTARSRLALGLCLRLSEMEDEELVLLPGIGPVLADRIARHRSEAGVFKQPSDLQQVHGIGPARVEALRPLLCASDL